MKALIVADVQNDFCPGGALAVPDGDLVVPVINGLMPRFDLVVATQDWHPPDHGSFAVNHPGRQPGEVIDLGGLEQVLWPVHCAQGTAGAELHPGLNRAGITRVFQKGTDKNIDSYSGFFDNGHRKATGLGDYLRQQGVTGVYVCGLTTDYCVKATALDALGLGFVTCLVEDACRGIDLSPGDVQRAIAQMKNAGARVVKSTDMKDESK
jgi:nicotinamidase/pyrazinamidase